MKTTSYDNGRGGNCDKQDDAEGFRASLKVRTLSVNFFHCSITVPIDAHCHPFSQLGGRTSQSLCILGRSAMYLSQAAFIWALPGFDEKHDQGIMIGSQAMQKSG